MAIKQVVSEGIGFDASVIGFFITEGFGVLAAAAGSAMPIPRHSKDRGAN